MQLFVFKLLLALSLMLGFVEFNAFQQHSPKILFHKILYLDQNISTYEEDMLVQAAQEWNEVTNGQVIFDIQKYSNILNIRKHNAIIVKKIPESIQDVRTLDRTNSSSTLGLFNNSHEISYIGFVTERMKNHHYFVVSLHELGHALGLSHLSNQETIMAPSIDYIKGHVTDADLVQFCDLYDCDPNTFAPLVRVNFMSDSHLNDRSNSVKN